MTKHSLDTPQFYLTAPQPCPYLPDRQERKVFTHLIGENARQINDMLTHGGFRRSQNIAYRPACEHCRACISTRVVVDAYKPSRNVKRVCSKNLDIVASELPASPTAEQYSIFRTYLDERHQDGGMVDMTALDYAMMVEDTHVDTQLVEYRIRDENGGIHSKNKGKLVGVALTDVLSNGLSMVYSFFDPGLSSRSLGTYMIAEHIQRARSRGLPYVYLGYWVSGSTKMRYKTRFRPQEQLTMNGWRVVK